MGLEILVVLVVQYLAQGDQVVQDLPLVLSILKEYKAKEIVLDCSKINILFIK